MPIKKKRIFFIAVYFFKKLKKKKYKFTFFLLFEIYFWQRVWLGFLKHSTRVETLKVSRPEINFESS